MKQMAMVLCGALLLIFARPGGAETPEVAALQGFLFTVGLLLFAGGFLWWGATHGR